MAAYLRIGESILKFFLAPLSRLNQQPILYQGLRFHLVYFGLFAGLAGFFGVLISAYYLNLKGVVLSANIWWLYVPIVCAVWFGARLGHLVALGRKFFETPKTFLRETRFYVQAAIFGLIPTVIGLGYALQLPPVVLLDSIAYGGLFALFIGRLGCYNYGCCFGMPTTLPWAIRYQNPQSKVVRLHPRLCDVSLHPVQLYTALGNLVAFALVTVWIAFVPRDGALAVFFLLYHGMARYLLDRWRHIELFDHRKGRPLPNVALVTIAAGVALLLLGPWFLPDFLSSTPRPLVSAPSFLGFMEYLSIHPIALAVAMGCAAILFIGYGVHGEELGTFAKFKRRSGGSRG